MITTGEDSDFFFYYLINEAMFLIDAARPASFEFVFERLWLARASEGFSLNLFY